MNARMRSSRWVKGAGLLALSLLMFTGCSSSSGSKNGGCGGACCRGVSTEPSGTLANPTQRTPLATGANTGWAGETPPPRGEGPYGGQKTCPVTGEKLGSMGPAIPVTIKGQIVYVCCRGCVTKVQREPDTYLAKVQAELGVH